MRAFQVTPKLSHAIMIKEVQKHISANIYQNGEYWENGHGCPIGCALYSAVIQTGEKFAFYGHDAFPEYLGIPTPVAQFMDWCFERLPIPEQAAWSMDFINAIADGADLDLAANQILVRIRQEIALPFSGSFDYNDAYTLAALSISRIVLDELRKCV